MKTILLYLLTISVVFAQKKTNQKDWQPLFNGKDLTGWDIKIAGQPVNDNYKNTFRVQDGMLRVMYDEYQNFDDKYGHLYYKTPYSHYILKYQYRFQGNQTKGGAVWNVRNSGVMFHSQSAQSLSFGQGFPVSLEMQLLGGLGKGGNAGATRHTGNLCTPGTQVSMKGGLRMEHCIDSDSKTYDGDQWINAELIVLGDSVAHQIIEGDTVLTFEKLQIGGGFVDGNMNWKAGGISDEHAEAWIKKDGTALGEGYIALQAESHPIDFRNIELLNLVGCRDPKALNYRTYYQKSDPKACVYRK